MAARAISSATISFGLVSIPVKLFTTNQSGSQVSFNMLHECGTRLKQQYICPKHDVVVPREDQVKGYEFAKGQYVLFSPAELKGLEAEASRLIEIREFIPLAEIDPVFFDKTYYLGPDKGGDKPYKLLSKAMQETGRCALASYAARGKQYLVMLRPYEDGLAMQQLRYAEEVKSFAEIERIDADLTDQELSLAVALIDQIAADAFDPTQYEDAVQRRLQEVIASKVEGEEITFAEAEEPEGKIIDLMEALKASLDGNEAGDADRKGPKRAQKPKAKSVRKKRTAKGA